MGLIDFIKGELIDIIEWMENDNDTIAFRYERQGNEIKNGAKLVVREGQAAAFINEGQLADIFEPGTYELTTKNLPVLSRLKGWKYGFESPFKAEVYFISTRNMEGFKWGTPGPFRIRDKEFGILEMVARGSFTLHVSDPQRFIKNVVGTDGEFTKDEIKDRLRKRFVTEAISAIGGTGKSFYEMSGHYDELSKELQERVTVTFWEKYGLTVDEVNLQSIDLTETSRQKVESRDEAMFADSRIGNYERQARADAMKLMAANPGSGGMGANMMGMGVGMGMANQMAGMMNPGMMNPGMAAPPPPPAVFMLYVNGQQQGPYPVQQIAQLIQQGTVNAQTNVWKQGMPAWSPAAAVPELAGLFQQAPPPPPEAGN
ncbi:MAG: SPFH domain-containing protein [Spirochaetales bacterium]|nr:SPFH domain-containing protein [Spirochaetales bacterium]